MYEDIKESDFLPTDLKVKPIKLKPFSDLTPI